MDRYDWETDEFTLFDYQRSSVQRMAELAEVVRRPRLCLYYKTGAGKTLTALACVRVTGATTVTVIAPPTTHEMWKTTAEALGFTDVITMSHAKYRQKQTKLQKDRPLIADEMHMFGGYQAIGWRKLDRFSAELLAPLIIASATPNYNDVERCYCIQRITDRRSTEGGYLAFVYKHCDIEPNPWGRVPRVIAFTKYPDAATFLADLKNVEYIEDDLTYEIEDVPLSLEIPWEFETLGVDRRKQRVMASLMEKRHRAVQYLLLDDGDRLVDDVFHMLCKQMEEASTPVLLFAMHTQVAAAVHQGLERAGYTGAVVTGVTPSGEKRDIIGQFNAGDLQFLVGTATLSTGTDGMDKVCDMLVIVDDTDDNAMRRQLIGRIMPRGKDSSMAHTNRVIRLVAEPLIGPTV